MRNARVGADPMQGLVARRPEGRRHAIEASTVAPGWWRSGDFARGPAGTADVKIVPQHRNRACHCSRRPSAWQAQVGRAYLSRSRWAARWPNFRGDGAAQRIRALLEDRTSKESGTSIRRRRGVAARRSATKSLIEKRCHGPPLKQPNRNAHSGGDRGLVIESPQILQRTTAARQQQNVVASGACGASSMATIAAGAPCLHRPAESRHHQRKPACQPCKVAHRGLAPR